MDSNTTELLGAPSPPSSSSSTNSWTYDVFLSFRGEDTRYNFTDHLHKNLVQKGIRTFIDDELPRGEEISQALLDAIEGSRCSIVVFSENYASSKWCLDELVHIIQCRKSKQQMVWPVFYKVDPSDVRNQRGSYGEALNNHERKFKEEKLTNHDESKFEDNMKKVLRWKETLTKAANLSGSHYLKSRETEFIQNIVNEISLQVLNDTHINVAKYQVGIEARVQDLHKVLDVDGNDVRMVGIWGNGGIGKTTVAKAVYNSLAHMFEGSCFLDNVRERSLPYGGLVDLQNLLLYEILRGKEIRVTSADKGINVIKERLSRKKVLLIVDDVDHLDQLNNLVGGCDWFGLGSRIIITTRDKHLLTCHRVSIIYEAKKLNYHESLDLFFSWNGFTRTRNLDDDYVERAEFVVDYAGGLPLALKVLGSHLCGRSIDVWHDALDGALHSDIQKTLKISYDALEDLVKEVFLDIACFFKGKDMNNVISILEGCDLKPKHAIEVLVEKALIYIEQNKIWMHDLLEELGRGIVHQESPNEPGERSRVWFHEDVHRVLTEGTGTNNVKGIIAKCPTPDDICLSDDSFSKMKNLRLFINVNARFSGDHVDYLSNELRFLHWPECPLQVLPSTFNPRKLVELYMPCSRLSQLGEGLKRLQNLKSVNLENCQFLTKTSNFYGIPNLEFLNLDGCTSLVHVDPSVGFLKKLIRLSLKGCCKLTILLRSIDLKSLESIYLSGCRKLENFPEIEGKMESLTWMDISHTAIKELPSSIGYLTGLKTLLLLGCENLTNLPGSIYDMKQLKVFYLRGCPKLVAFPNQSTSEVSTSAENVPSVLPANINVSPDSCGSLLLPNLEELDVKGGNLSEINFLGTLHCASTLFRLDLSGSKFVTFPICISKFVSLRILDLHGCNKLVEIPELPPKIGWLDACDCVSLERFLKLSNILECKESQMIRWMDLSNCQRLCRNLAHGVAKTKNVLVNDQGALFSYLFLISSQQSKFQVVFPGNEVPKRFICHKDLEEVERYCEFYIEIPENFKWQNSGLALYAAVKKTQDAPYPCYINNNGSPYFIVEFYVNEKRIHLIRSDFGSTILESDHVWLYYIPFCKMEFDESAYPKPPFKCRVSFELPFNSSLCVKSFGAHLVMPEYENVSTSMEGLIHEGTSKREIIGEDIGSPVEDDYLSCEGDEELD
ncbi:hypothetical protein L3X38_043567 [Prunus dulcis]|uniref:TIR domain-containing protein n=1 Tax=Prunus dulcis TaxID=3755 RepID=A0AAD4YMA4_PRUDU|nr:hypothetical protein L3X38_043567 [Prunus dulcis]